MLSEPNNSFTSTTIEHGLAIAKIPVNTFAIKKDQCHFSQLMPRVLSIMEITRVSGLEIITIMGRGYKNFPFSMSFTLRRNSNVIYFCINLNVIEWYTGKDKVEERKGKIYKLHGPHMSYLQIWHFSSKADPKFTENNVGSTDRITK